MTEPITITLIIPTVSRPALVRCLFSISEQDWQPGDEVILVGDGPQPRARALWEHFQLPGHYREVPGPNRDWGHTPRNLVMPEARGTHLMALDDDDLFLPHTILTVREALAACPDRPHMFKMEGIPCGGRVWKDREVRHGNVGTPMFVVPTAGRRWAAYPPYYGGDHAFIRDTLELWPPDALVWRDEVICHVRP